MSRVNRRDVFNPNEVGVYHNTHRCVRRAFLCGWDERTNRSYDHRKLWIEDQLIMLSSIFAFDVLSYAVMDNHCHLVTRNRPDILSGWSDQDVLTRWWQLCPKRREADGSPAIATEQDLATLLAEQGETPYRARLGSISWFMRYLAEPIARRANREDDCTGHFWEGRFKCQRLLDEASLLACCAYVDLNPIRAGIVDLPENSRYTSIYKRIAAQIEEAAQITAGRVMYPDRSLNAELADANKLLETLPVANRQTELMIEFNEVDLPAADREVFAPGGTDASVATSEVIETLSAEIQFDKELEDKELEDKELEDKELEIAATSCGEVGALSGNAISNEIAEMEPEGSSVSLATALMESNRSQPAQGSLRSTREACPDAWLAPVELDPRAAAYSGAMPSRTNSRASDKGFLHMTSETYIKLIDWIGRQVRGDRGTIPATALPILERIGLSPDAFCDLVQRFGKIFKQAAGAPASLAQEAARRKQRWIQCNNSPLKDAVAVSSG